MSDYKAKGPDQLNILMGILIKFREEEEEYIEAIRRMYSNARFTTPGQQTHVFLWRDLNIEKEPEEYIMGVGSFGDKSAPTIVQRALQKTADLATSD